MNEIIIKTSCGLLKGIQYTDQTQQFLGIQYATATRWAYPKEITTWDGIYDATAFRDSCIQRRTFYPESDDSFYYREFRKDELYTYSEDCQYLNIWKPVDCQNAPVILYLHGGAFQGGCGNEKPFEGSFYAKKGVIFITCNYRLGALGFCSLPELTERDGHSGNYGLYDQLTALQWVYHNIEQFGGNAENITLMGQSAGAISVQQLCAAPLAKKYISQAIMTSGGGVSDSFSKLINMENAYPFWKDVTKELGSTLDDWLNTPPQLLLDTMNKTAAKYDNALQYFMPVIDQELICYDQEALATQKVQASVPYIMGSTKDDLFADVLADMAKSWVIQQSSQNMKPSYCFYFGRDLPGDEKGAWHSSELWYTIGALSKCWRPWTDWDHTISKTLMSYFANFAKTGDPNGADLPELIPTKCSDDPILVINNSEIEMNTVL